MHSLSAVRRRAQTLVSSLFGAPPRLRGYVDEIAVDRIRGWIARAHDFTAPVNIKIYLDDVLVSSGLADDYREDLEKVGFGNGRFGYNRGVPKRRLLGARELKVAGVVDGEEIELLRRPLFNEATAAHRKKRAVFLDLSDLFEYLSYHREVSGIQRVQVGYALGLLESSQHNLEIKLCARLRGQIHFLSISHAALAKLLSDAGSPKEISAEGWRLHVASFLRKLNTRADFKKGDILLTMGAPWATEHHNEAIRIAKRETGILYFQIFYDLIPISRPEVVAVDLIPMFARAMAATITYSDHIFSISAFSADELRDACKRLGKKAPPISLIRMGGTIDDAETGKDNHSEAASALPSRRADIGPFVLCVGTLEPRKNHILLYQVWQRLVAAHGVGAVPKLVLVGRIGWYMEDFMRMLRVSGYVDGTILHLPNVSNVELKQLYDACLFTVFPSVYEGWGLPITESMLHGKLCVCSNVTSMPEAGEKWAVYIDPYSVEGAYATIERLIFDPEERAAKQAAMVAGFAPVTWSQAAGDFKKTLFDAIAGVQDGLSAYGEAQRRVLSLDHLYFFGTERPTETAFKTLATYLDDEKIADVLEGDDWFEREGRLTWACGPEARIALTFGSDSPPKLIAYFDLAMLAAHLEERIEVIVDGCSRGFVRFRSSNSAKLCVRLHGEENKGRALREHHIRFVLEDRRYRAATATDNRWLGIGISTLYVCEDDVSSRLRYHERDTVHLGRVDELEEA